MMTIRWIGALAFGASLVAGAAVAQTPYVSLEGGWNHPLGLSLHGSGSPLAASTDLDDGYIVGGAAGLAYGPYRFELNLDWRHNDVNSVHIGNPGALGAFATGSAGGNVHALTATLNATMDLPLHLMVNGLVPYVGGGIGVAHMSLDGVSSAGKTLIDSSDTEPAFVGILGVRYDLNTNWAASLQYDFLDALNPHFRDPAGNGVSTNNYVNHSILLRVTYSFGAPPAPPPPMPAAAPAPAPVAPAPIAAPAPGPRELFLVFFDFNKATLTNAGRQVLDEAEGAFQKERPIRIELTGYTDTVGTQRYNLGLSKRRAEAAANYLASKGIPRDRMDVSWRGKDGSARADA
ncbi:MAG: OmpA family protein [Stellaceae bacterium]